MLGGIGSVLLIGAFLCSACTKQAPPDTSQLSALAKQQFQLLKIVRGVNDISTTVITANKLGKITDEATDIILRVNKQVLDVIETNPFAGDWLLRSRTIVSNVMDALPPTLRAQAEGYLQQILAVLQGA